MIAPPLPPIVPILAKAAERRIVARLRGAHATVEERAVSIDGTSWMESRRLAHLVRVGAVQRTAAERYYLSEPVYEEYVSRRRRLAIIAIAAAVLAAAAVALLY